MKIKKIIIITILIPNHTLFSFDPLYNSWARQLSDWSSELRWVAHPDLPLAHGQENSGFPNLEANTLSTYLPGLFPHTLWQQPYLGLEISYCCISPTPGLMRLQLTCGDPQLLNSCRLGGVGVSRQADKMAWVPTPMSFVHQGTISSRLFSVYSLITIQLCNYHCSRDTSLITSKKCLMFLYSQPARLGVGPYSSAFSKISYKWSRTEDSLLSQASFTPHDALRIHPHCSITSCLFLFIAK